MSTHPLSLQRITSLAPCLVALSIGLQACDPGLSGLDFGKLADLQRRADQLVAAGVPGVALLVRDGEQTVQVVAGRSDLATARRMQASDRFSVGSLTKTYTATVVLQLVREGRLQLGDSVEQWLPGLVTGNQTATVEQLLRHQAGLFDYFGDPRPAVPYLEGAFDHVWTPQQLVGFATEHEPLFAPGAQIAYSNTHYTLLGLIAEKASGRALTDLVVDRIIAPLGLAATTFPTVVRHQPPEAHGYLVGDGEPLDITGINPSVAWATGNIVSNAQDVATFYRALLDGRLLGGDQQRAMLSFHAASASLQFGLGLVRTTLYPCDTFIGHNGTFFGYKSRAYQSLDGRRQFVILVNSDAQDGTVGPEGAEGAFRELTSAAACDGLSP
jgi:D-alanyl-D-alanine carboxypeptidase